MAELRAMAWALSIRAKLLVIALLLLLIPLIGFRFLQEMDAFLLDGQQQVLASTAKLLSATLSDRPALLAASRALPESDESERRRMLALFSSADPETAADLGAAYQPSEGVEKILGVVAGTATRIWVVDGHSRVRGLGGSLVQVAGAQRTGILASLYATIVRPLARPAESVSLGASKEDAGVAQRVVMGQVERALRGEPNALRRATVVGGGTILSVAQPVWQGEEIVAAVVVEESTGRGQTLRTTALESLLAATLVVLLVGFVSLLVFAWRLAFRVRRLQAEAESAIDAHGRIRGSISGSGSQDEIGALAQTLSATLERLNRYNGYLEQMAARLSHELRTPVAVVRSSLDNLRQGDIREAERVYIERADEGVARLSSLVSRMSEASQLESMLHGAEKELFEPGAVVRGLVEGYRLAYPGQVFELAMDGNPAVISGVPDALAQLLDKLVQNAADFAAPGTPVTISLCARAGEAVLAVENVGPPLPEDAAGNLFQSMVSTRSAGASRDSHLGLGLYIVRLIAEFHGATVRGENLANGKGVRFQVAFSTVMPMRRRFGVERR